MNNNRNYVTKSIFQNRNLQEAIKYLIDNNVEKPIEYLYDAVKIHRNHAKYKCNEPNNLIIKKILEIFNDETGLDFASEMLTNILKFYCGLPCKKTKNLGYSLVRIGSALRYDCPDIPTGTNSTAQLKKLMLEKALYLCSVKKENIGACLHGYIDDKILTCLQDVFIDYGKGNLTDVDCEMLSIQTQPWNGTTSQPFQISDKTSSSIYRVVTNVTNTIVNSSINVLHNEFLSNTSEGNNKSSLIPAVGSNCVVSNDTRIDNHENNQNFSAKLSCGIWVGGIAMVVVFGFSALVYVLYAHYKSKTYVYPLARESAIMKKLSKIENKLIEQKPPSTTVDCPEKELNTERVTELKLLEL
ncbi:MAG: hypothetical protein HRK26_02270 [Rickettsiaceae bacterium H1]|nr:hypothetical protein [Rickettsiaceae bacterium H1]